MDAIQVGDIIRVEGQWQSIAEAIVVAESHMPNLLYVHIPRLDGSYAETQVLRSNCSKIS